MKRNATEQGFFRSVHRRWAICLSVLVCLGTAILAAAADPRDEARGRCSSTTDGGCSTNRLTFGFYPTTWHRWPEPHPAAAEPENKNKPRKKVEEKKAEQEKKEPETTTEDEDKSPVPPDEALPEGAEQPQQQTPTLAPQAPAAAEPGAQPGKQGEDPEKIFNESSKTPESSKAKPADAGSKANGDPFSDDKDEPSKDQPAKDGDDTSSTQRLRGDQASGMRWRANPIRRVGEQEVIPQPEALDSLDDSHEPRLFQPLPSTKPMDDNDEPPVFQPEQSVSPIEKTSFVGTTSPARTNPLRSPGAAPRWSSSGQTLRTSNGQ